MTTETPPQVQKSLNNGQNGSQALQSLNNGQNGSQALQGIKGKIQKAVFGAILNTPLLVGKRISVVRGVANIPLGEAIFATSHLSDQDVLLVAQNIRAHHPRMSIVSQRTNLEDSVIGPIQRAAGPGRFLSIENKRATINRQGSEWDYVLKRDNFRGFRESIDQGNSVVIAGHRPTFDGKLPPRMGVGAIILAYLSGKPLIPSVVTNAGLRSSIDYLPAFELPDLTEENKDNLIGWSQRGSTLNGDLIKILFENAQQLKKVFEKTLGITPSTGRSPASSPPTMSDRG